MKGMRLAVLLAVAGLLAPVGGSAQTCMTLPGSGASVWAARQGAIRLALQATQEQLVIADRSIVGNEIVEDAVRSTLNGFVESIRDVRLATVGEEVEGEFEVCVSQENVGLFVGDPNATGGSAQVSGNQILARINAERMAEQAKGEMVYRILRDAPQAFHVRLREIGDISDDGDWLELELEYGFDEEYLEFAKKALEEAGVANRAVSANPDRDACDGWSFRIVVGGTEFCDEEYEVSLPPPHGPDSFRDYSDLYVNGQSDPHFHLPGWGIAFPFLSCVVGEPSSGSPRVLAWLSRRGAVYDGHRGRRIMLSAGESYDRSRAFPVINTWTLETPEAGRLSVSLYVPLLEDVEAIRVESGALSATVLERITYRGSPEIVAISGASGWDAMVYSTAFGGSPPIVESCLGDSGFDLGMIPSWIALTALEPEPKR